jgi:hypothetical protein
VLCELDEPVAGRRLVDGSPAPRGERDPLDSPDSS